MAQNKSSWDKRYSSELLLSAINGHLLQKFVYTETFSIIKSILCCLPWSLKRVSFIKPTQLQVWGGRSTIKRSMIPQLLSECIRLYLKSFFLSSRVWQFYLISVDYIALFSRWGHLQWGFHDDSFHMILHSALVMLQNRNSRDVNALQYILYKIKACISCFSFKFLYSYFCDILRKWIVFQLILQLSEFSQLPVQPWKPNQFRLELDCTGTLLQSEEI